MSYVWNPEKHPPLVTPDARLDVLTDLVLDQPHVATSKFTRQLRTDCEPVADYVEHFGKVLNETFNDIWPSRAFKLGAALAYAAYRSAGYFPRIESPDDESFKNAFRQIAAVPLPDMLEESAETDRELAQLIWVSVEATIPDVGGGVKQVGLLGAGCTRIFTGHALAA